MGRDAAKISLGKEIIMISEDGKFVICDKPNCNKQIKNHHWGRVKAVNWFFSKSGKAFCPDHVPEWVTFWRKKGVL